MLTWILHRIGGLAMLLFIGMHVMAGFSMQQFGSNLGTAFNAFYEAPYFQVILYFFVIFHAINGLRIIVLDIWPRLLEYQPELTWLEWLVILPLYGLAVFIMLQHALSGG
jgi:succinate dehydrogenase / fumarate reductase cytochrome b subunit